MIRLSLPAASVFLSLCLLLPTPAQPQSEARYRPPPGSLATSTIMWRLDSACTGGGPGGLAACDTIAMHHYATRDKGERRQAAERWREACAAGGVGACANLALAYDDGEGVKRDRGQALALGRSACDSGSAPGCVLVASMLSDGRGGTKDAAAGNQLMSQACTMGDLYACLNMAYRALDGSFGMARDTVGARTYAGRACSVAVKDHPYPWYRRTANEACALSGELGPPPAAGSP